MTLFSKVPLSLYIHFPWCVKKCPYCDFNSHTLKNDLPEEEYIHLLLQNFEQNLPYVQDRELISIFMGGGTPSLFSANAIERLLDGIRNRISLTQDCEITLEANPGTVEQKRFKAYRAIGINRLSVGIQSFNPEHLQALGRIHNGQEAIQAVQTVVDAGFTNFNLDIMFGLPQQSMDQGLADLTQAIALDPTHISWYELTLEPNTAFWHNPPPLPKDEVIGSLQEQGQALLDRSGFKQYEVSAYSRDNPSRHNLNYWEFGDYLAIGAGSHGKITHDQKQVIRYHHFRHPKQYMDLDLGFIQETKVIAKDQLAFEFCLNTLRLINGVPSTMFFERTGLDLHSIRSTLEVAQQKGLLQDPSQRLVATKLGYRFLNDLTTLFLPETNL